MDYIAFQHAFRYKCIDVILRSEHIVREQTEWYVAYKLQYNRRGLLGDVSSLLGILSIDIIMINGIEKSKRGMLLLSERDEHIERLKTILDKVDTIKVTKIRKSKLRDRLAVRNGK